MSLQLGWKTITKHVIIIHRLIVTENIPFHRVIHNTYFTYYLSFLMVFFTLWQYHYWLQQNFRYHMKYLFHLIFLKDEASIQKIPENLNDIATRYAYRVYHYRFTCFSKTTKLLISVAFSCNFIHFHRYLYRENPYLYPSSLQTTWDSRSCLHPYSHTDL